MTRTTLTNNAKLNPEEEEPSMDWLWELVQDQKRYMKRQSDTLDSLQARLAALNQASDSEDSAPATRSTLLSRKGLLGAAAASAAGLVGVGTFLHPGVAEAANPVLLGSGNTATALTQINASAISGVTAFQASSSDTYGIVSRSATQSGIWGRGGNAGVFGDTVDGSGIAVHGFASSGGTGVQGFAIANYGVAGYSTSFIGVSGNSDQGFAVQGQSTTGFGVEGQSGASYGGAFNGGLAPLVLNPAGSQGAPASQTHDQGAIYIDSLGVPYICEAHGTPGTWQAVGNLRSFPAGHRVFNNPMAPGGLNTGISALTDIHGGPTGVPATALAVYCAVQSYESGTLTIFPDGASEPTAANWSGVGTTGILNLLYMLVPLSSASKFSIRSHLTATGQVYVDVWGYLM